MHIFLAQLWKYNGERLESKNGEWMYMEETWILPVRKTSKRGLAKLFSYKTKKATDDGQAIRSSIGHLNAYLDAYSDSGGMYLNFLAQQLCTYALCIFYKTCIH